jgi:hypothetical protein
MATSAPVAFVHGYTAEVYRIAAQREAKLRKAARVKTGVKGKTVHFERLGPSDLATVTARHAPTNILNPEHSRRRVTLVDKEGSILLDPFDELKMLIAPGNDYAMNHAEAINRFYDDILIAALGGSATSVDGADATSAITLASFASGVHEIAAGGTGMTFEKVNQALRLLNEQDTPYDNRWFAISPQGLEDLLAEPEATSNDFVKQQLTAIQQGRLTGTWMSFNWIVSTRLPKSSTTRSNYAWHQSALGLAIAAEMRLLISKRNDLAGTPTQVQAWCSAGATRIEEAKVVEVDITES